MEELIHASWQETTDKSDKPLKYVRLRYESASGTIIGRATLPQNVDSSIINMLNSKSEGKC